METDLDTLPADPAPPAAEPAAAAPERFPMSLAEYAYAARLDILWVRGLEVTTDGSDRMREEWDRLLAEFQSRPVTS